MTWFPKVKKGPRIKSTRVESDGRSFMSKGECACYGFLKLQESSGLIQDLKCQVTVRLTEAQLRWVMDFSYEEKGELVFADYKGFETERWMILKKLWPFYGPARLVIYKGKKDRIFVSEEIIPRKAA